jgi:peptide/nickel transport system ATP-binding protein
LASLLEIKDLQTWFYTDAGIVKAVDGVSYGVELGETLALVGESGCGKSVSALSVMRLIAQPPGKIIGGQVLFEGRDLLTVSDGEMRSIRGREIGMIFQEPMTSLNPVLTIGRQLTEALELHLGMSTQQARSRAVELLETVEITDAERRLDQYPHHFSGGMRQRIMLAMAISCNPQLVIADEPTTALDVTIQAQLLGLMKNLTRQLDMALILITHNLGIVARYADRVDVMYGGRIVEDARAGELYANPRHPYTLGLMRSVPRLDLPRQAKLVPIEGQPPNPIDLPPGCSFQPRCPYAIDRCVAEEPRLEPVGPRHTAACWVADELDPADPRVASVAGNGILLGPTNGSQPRTREAAEPSEVLLDVRGLKMYFPVTSGHIFQKTVGHIRAVDDVSFTIRRGQTLGLVGESGCGKSTTGRCIIQLYKPTAGEVRFQGNDLMDLEPNEMGRLRREMQIIFQDPYSSLNPRMTAGQIVSEPLSVHKLISGRGERRERVEELFTVVGLNPRMAGRYPHEFSGGQRQRIGIARALAVSPSVSVCVVPVSALDVSIQAQVINLLDELQEKFNLTYLFIAHDLSVVRHIADRVAVMYLGHIVEIASGDELYANPLHPYTRALLSAAPVPDPRVEATREPIIIQGEIPSPLNPPVGCVFHTRCPIMEESCKAAMPQLREVAPDHWVACYLV